MPSSNPVEVILKFEQLINSRTPSAISGLLTEDSVFIDSLGNRITGADKLRPAWESYFKVVPDYSISHSEVFSNGETAVLFGSAQGTFSKVNLGKRTSGKHQRPGEPLSKMARSRCGRFLPTTNPSVPLCAQISQKLRRD